MPEIPQSDTARAKSVEPDQTWPELVEIRMHWRLPNSAVLATSEKISADEFFGKGAQGAPLSGEQLIAKIEKLRRAGPPKDKPRNNYIQRGKDVSKR